MVFADEFDGTAVDRRKWAIHSNAEADRRLGNKGSQQLEVAHLECMSVRDGLLICARGC